ncbi:hypothetical protein [Nonomuraea dietziae]|uniref:hypothetical protein n=1 Tax=Nonomuraea dietziae TaxID=65515 RepID=UPI0031D1CFA0
MSYQVEVPEGLRVKVGSDSGGLTLKNLSGEVEATTDSGGDRGRRADGARRSSRGPTPVT